MIEETIAKLVGRIELVADTGPLLMFQRMMNNTSQQMRDLAKQADVLTTKLNKKLGISNNSAQQTKQSRDMQASLIREQRALVGVEKARRATMEADLAQRKLTLADSKQEAYTVSESLKAKQAAAVVAARQYKAEQERLKAASQVIKQQQSVTSYKLRQAALEERLAQAKSRTAIAAQKELQSLTATQRMERALLDSRERANRAAVKFRETQAAAQLRLQRQGERHEQSKARFIWQQERQTAWAARQEERNNPAPESGLSTALMGLGAVGGAVASITIALDKLAARIDHRQEVAADTQQFDNMLLAASKDHAQASRIRKAYIDQFQEFGMEISRESGLQYSNQVQGFLAQGKTEQQALALQRDQQAMFRIGGLNAQQQYSAALQLSQGKHSLPPVSEMTQ